MTMQDYEYDLQRNCDNFLRHWGPISWRDHVQSMPQRNDSSTALLLHGLAGIEDDSFYMQKKLRYGGAARLAPVRQFNAVWMVEEAEHGRALAGLASKYGWVGGDQLHDTLHRDKRAALALPLLKLISPYERGMLGAYMCLGVLVEYIAITSYNGIAAMQTDLGLRDVLGQMSRQEGRHLRFYGVVHAPFWREMQNLNLSFGLYYLITGGHQVLICTVSNTGWKFLIHCCVMMLCVVVMLG